MKKTEKFWSKTNVPNLYQHRNCRYYARLFVGGKEIWKSLKTKMKSVAVERLQEHVVNARQQRASGVRLATGTLTFADVVEKYRENFRRDAEIKEGTKNFREAGIKRVLKTWPGVGQLNVRKITVPMVRDWALKLRTEARKMRVLNRQLVTEASPKLKRSMSGPTIFWAFTQSVQPKSTAMVPAPFPSQRVILTVVDITTLTRLPTLPTFILRTTRRLPPKLLLLRLACHGKI